MEDRKAEDIRLLNLPPDTVIADFLVLATGSSDRQLKALAEYVRAAVRDRCGVSPFATEGDADSGWVIVDYGDVIVHLFREDQRRYYDLESFWREANVLLRIQ